MVRTEIFHPFTAGFMLYITQLLNDVILHTLKLLKSNRRLITLFHSNGYVLFSLRKISLELYVTLLKPNMRTRFILFRIQIN